MGFVFRATRPLRFHRNETSVSFSNPRRRWLYHHIALASLAAGTVYLTLQYQWAKVEARKGEAATNTRICSTSLLDFLMLLPLNRMSNLMGQLAASGTLPVSWHHRAIDCYRWYYDVDMRECASENFDSFSEFYARRWLPECRPVDTSAAVISPCDGIILSVEDNVTAKSLVQVKGLHYGIEALFQVTPEDPPAGYKRVAVVVHLRMQDFHHVISPADFNCHGSVYVPGALLPTTVAGFHWLPQVLTQNERLVVYGASADGAKSTVMMALVGSTLTGKMNLTVDSRIRTNFLDPSEYAVHTSYKTQPLLKSGAPVGSFMWGSSVVLLMDVPQGQQFTHKKGDVLKAGAALLH